MKKRMRCAILGTGKIVVHDPWYKPHTMTIYTEGAEPRLIEMPLSKYNGYEYEALAVNEVSEKFK